MSNHETEQEIIKTDDGFSEKKLALQIDNVVVQIPQSKKKSKKQKENVIYEEK